MRSIGSLALVLALGPWMASAAAVAPEHVHGADAGHAHSVTHRHIDTHDQDRTEIEPGQGRVLWLSGPIAVQCPAFQLAVGQAAIPADLHVAPPLLTWSLAPMLDGSPPHGPPRHPDSLRAPPAFPSLAI